MGAQVGKSSRVGWDLVSVGQGVTQDQESAGK